VNFKTVKTPDKLGKRYRGLYENNIVLKREIKECVLKYSNVVSEIQYILKVIN